MTNIAYQTPAALVDETPQEMVIADQLLPVLDQEITGLLVEASEHINDGTSDIRSRVRELLTTRGLYTQDTYLTVLTTLARRAERFSRYLLMDAVAPTLYEMRRPGAVQRLIDPRTGDNYQSWDDWVHGVFGFSHTHATNLINIWQNLVPMVLQQGITMQELIDEVDISKLQLIIPTVMEHKRAVTQLLKTAKRQGVDPQTVTLPPPPDLRTMIDQAKDLPYRDFKRSLSQSGTEKDDTRFRILVERLDDGRYHYEMVVTKDEALSIDKRLGAPAYYDRKTKAPLPTFYQALQSEDE